MRLSLAFSFGDVGVEHQVFVRPTAEPERVLERWPVDDVRIISVRVSRPGESRPVAADRAEEGEVCRTKDVRSE